MDLKSKTVEELMQFATDMGIELNGTEKKDRLLVLIAERAADDKTTAAEGLSEDLERKAAVLRSRRLAERNFCPKLSGKYVKVMVNRSDETGKSVVLGLNGVVYRVQTDTEMALPVEVYEACLKNTKKTVMEQDPKTMEISTYETPTYPHQYMGPTSKPVQARV